VINAVTGRALHEFTSEVTAHKGCAILNQAEEVLHCHVTGKRPTFN
jgi:hypothetical protein